MVFSSPLFLFLFLPLLLGLYFTWPKATRNVLLLAASLLFYAWGEPAFVLVMLASIAMNYVFGLAVDRTRETSACRWILGAAVAANLALLGYHKYAGFLVDNLNAVLAAINLTLIEAEHRPLPLGISFFTFQAISYVVDVYRRDGGAQRNPLNVALYISLFPQLIAGPIVRFRDIAAQISRRVVTREGFAEGVQRFIVGLGKKVLLANTLGATADAVFAAPAGEISTGVAWLGLVCFTLQVYFDFSGYSDMAIGLGRMFGFRFLENFNYPYISRSITEFWRRWHISLSTWFRDYLYIPLGGSRVATWRTYLNLLAVFVLCGLWHGASWNFFVWGLMHGAILVMERLGLRNIIARRSAVFAHAYFLLTLLLTMVPFRTSSLAHGFDYYRALFGFTAGSEAFHIGLYLQPGLFLAMAAGVLGSTPLAPHLAERLFRPAASPSLVHRWRPAASAYVGAGVLFLVLAASMIEMSATTYNPFVYFRF